MSTDRKTSAAEDQGFVRSVGPLQATAINMTQMCGIGPFVTIPAMVATIGGPEAMFGWIIGALSPRRRTHLGRTRRRDAGAGGTYIYLREAFQYRTGRLMPFLFVWSAVLFIPLIMSTGIIGLVQYLGYLIPGVKADVGKHAAGQGDWRRHHAADHGGAVPQDRPNRQAHHGAVRRHAGRGLSTIVAAFSHFDAAQAFAFTPGAFGFGHGTFWAGLGAGLIIAVYDYLGYNTTAYLGAEMRDPGRTIPQSIVFSILGIMSLYFLLQIGVLGAVPLEELIEAATSVRLPSGTRASVGFDWRPEDDRADRDRRHRLGVRRSARRVPRPVRGRSRQGILPGVFASYTRSRSCPPRV